MSRKLNYRELDEMDWEYKHPVPDDEDYWGQDASEMYVDEFCATIPDTEPEAEDDETGSGIFGNELNHAPNAQNNYFTCIGLGRLSGHGEKDEIIRMIFEMLEPFKDYHYEFEFFKA